MRDDTCNISYNTVMYNRVMRLLNLANHKASNIYKGIRRIGRDLENLSIEELRSE